MRATQLFLTVVSFALGCGEEAAEPPTTGQVAGADLDDEFDGDLSAWELLNPDAAATRVEGGQLILEPAPNSLWFNARAGALVYQGVEGDFVATAHVAARGLADPSAPPMPQFRLGGLMARAPGAQGGENYVFIVVGADGDDVSVETKNTRGGSSMFDGPPFPLGEGDLRVCRIGSAFRLLIRENDAMPWQEQAVFDRPDMPEVLQVGPMGYANAADPDLQVRFDFVRFTAPQDAAACAG